MGCVNIKRNDIIVKIDKTTNLEMRKAHSLRINKGLFIEGYRCSPNERYDIVSTLGEGSFGVVFKVQDKKSGLYRAMKVMKKVKKNFNEEEENKMKNEINILKGLDHPNIIKVFEFYSTETNFYIISELCLGGELFDKIIKSKHFNENVAAHIMKQLLSAVHFCHQYNVIHRDIKPENIMLETKEDAEKNYFNIKLIDLGTASIFKDNTMLNKQIGTPYYIAPEVLNNNYNEKCDIWSCGVIMFILLCGSPPFHGKDDDEIYNSVKNAKYNFKLPIWHSVSDSAKNLIRSLFEIDINKRPSAARALNHQWFNCISNKTLSGTNHEYDTENESFYAKPNGTFTASFFNFTLVKDALINLKNFNAERKLQQATLYYLVHNLTKLEDIKDLRNIFYQFDENADGRLTKDEIQKGFEMSKFVKCNTVEIQNIMDRIDIDKNGFVEYEEFIAATINKKKLLTEENVKKAFDAFDRDNSGKISAEELKMVLSGGNEEEDKNVWKKIIKEIDSDGDGEISYEEFAAMMKNLVERS